MSAVSRVQQALDEATASQGRLNIFTSIEGEEALERAASIDAAIESGRYAGALAGMPIALKDLIDHDGRVTTCGSAFYRKTPKTSAVCVDRLEAEGAIVIGRAGLHEWAFGFSSENPHFGAVRNPWDPATSPGGSSGGSGAAVAAGVTPVAIGTDTGGSVRVPAALCGTFGLKVTHARVPLDGVFPLVPSADTVGPLADSIANLDAAYRAMSGDDSPPQPPSRLRIGVPQPWYAKSPTDAGVASAFESAVAALGDLGHVVEEIGLEDAVPSRHLVHSIADEVTQVHREFRSAGEVYGEDVATRLDVAASVTPEEMEDAAEWRSRLQRSFGAVFDSVDYLITPTVPAMRKVIGDDEINGRHHRTVLSYFTALVNQSLHPAIAMPLAGSGSPPASLQVIGRPGAEVPLLEFGRSLEAVGLVGFRLAPSSSPTPGTG